MNLPFHVAFANVSSSLMAFVTLRCPMVLAADDAPDAPLLPCLLPSPGDGWRWQRKADAGTVAVLRHTMINITGIW